MGFKVTINHWHGVANWTWNAGECIRAHHCSSFPACQSQSLAFLLLGSLHRLTLKNFFSSFSSLQAMICAVFAVLHSMVTLLKPISQGMMLQ
jgi:hypothetical protein